MKRFADQSNRMEIRRAVESLGADVAMYTENGGIMIAMPNNENQWTVYDVLSGFGMVSEGKDYYFPLGSDNPPAILRHHGPYKNQNPGMYLYVRFNYRENIN